MYNQKVNWTPIYVNAWEAYDLATRQVCGSVRFFKKKIRKHSQFSHFPFQRRFEAKLWILASMYFSAVEQELTVEKEIEPGLIKCLLPFKKGHFVPYKQWCWHINDMVGAHSDIISLRIYAGWSHFISTTVMIRSSTTQLGTEENP